MQTPTMLPLFTLRPTVVDKMHQVHNKIKKQFEFKNVKQKMKNTMFFYWQRIMKLKFIQQLIFP